MHYFALSLLIVFTATMNSACTANGQLKRQASAQAPTALDVEKKRDSVRTDLSQVLTQNEIPSLISNERTVGQPLATVESFHGVIHKDPYAYFELQTADGEPVDFVKEFIAKENAKSSAFFKTHGSTLEAVYAEIMSRKPPFDHRADSESFGDFEFSTERKQGQPFTTYYRKNKNTNIKSTLVDFNQRAEGKVDFQLFEISLSPDGSRVGWIEGTDGRYAGTLYIVDVADPDTILLKVENVGVTLAWGRNSNEVFYPSLDQKITWGSAIQRAIVDSGKIDIVYTEIHKKGEDKLTAYPERMDSGEGIFILSVNWSENETRQIMFDELNVSDKNITPSILISRKRQIEHSIKHTNGQYIIKVHGSAQMPDALYKTDNPTKPADQWEELYNAKNGSLSNLQVFNNDLVFVQMKNGADSLLKYNIESQTLSKFEFKEELQGLFLFEPFLGINSGNLKLRYESILSPRRYFKLDIASWDLQSLGDSKIAGYDPEAYVVDRLYIPSHDGVMVPITMVRKKSFITTGNPPPVFQYVYGGYGIGVPPEFPRINFSLIDRGFTYVVSHVRGGNELGRSWHDTGKLLHKRNSIEDFKAISRYLVENGYASEGNISVGGESASGMVVGAVINEMPSMYKSVAMLVPVVDVLNRLLNDTLSITQSDRSELGNPLVSAEYYNYIRSYSAIENIANQEYPHIYITAAYDDYAVSYWESLKYITAVRQHQTNSSETLIAVRDGSHIASGEGKVEYDYAKQVTFILQKHNQVELSF